MTALTYAAPAVEIVDARGVARPTPCPHCGVAGIVATEHAQTFAPIRDPARAPAVLWVIVLRTDGDALSRHRVSLGARRERAFDVTSTRVSDGRRRVSRHSRRLPRAAHGSGETLQPIILVR